MEGGLVTPCNSDGGGLDAARTALSVHRHIAQGGGGGDRKHYTVHIYTHYNPEPARVVYTLY